MLRKAELPVPTAKEINDAHRMARSSAETAVQHAIRCGQMLERKKAELDRGEFDGWVQKHCEFGRRMAYNYIKAGNSCNALHDSSTAAAAAATFSSLRGLLGIESKPQKKQDKPDTSAQGVKGAVMNPPESAAQGSEAGNRSKPIGVDVGPVRPPVPAPESDSDEPERPDDVDEDAALAAAEREFMASAEKAIGTDAVAEIRRLTAELSVVKLSRDGYMNGKDAITRMLKAEQRKTERLERQLTAKDTEIQRLKNEIDRLRERVAIMEAA